MADGTTIEWCRGADGRKGATWNVVTGCSVLSPGCTNCYAMKLAGTRLRHHPSRRGLTQESNAGPVWTGEVRFNEQWLDQPMRWQRPRLIFVAAHGDLFHHALPDRVIDSVFAIMAMAPQHTFQCLTKRAGRMRAYCSSPDVTHRIARAIDAITVELEHTQLENWRPIPDFTDYEASSYGRIRRGTTILQEQINKRFDRASITLWKNNEPTTIWVHRAVALAHGGLPIDGEEVCHRNGNRRDNRLANLRWGTRADNQQEKVRHGANGGPAKITREQAVDIRKACASGETQQSIADRYGISRSLVSMIKDRKVWADAIPWPLPNVWLGVSAEDQARANERIPHLLTTPAAVRFVSLEPLLGPIDLTHLFSGDTLYDALVGMCEVGVVDAGDRYVAIDPTYKDCGKLAQVIVGGESGPNARPMHPDWPRQIRDDCAGANVPFFFKQWGHFAPFIIAANERARQIDLLDGCQMIGVGKKAAGRLLDGVEHNGMPAEASA